MLRVGVAKADQVTPASLLTCTTYLVFFEDFADSALLLVLVFWVELGPLRLSGRRVDSDLRFAIEKGLAAAGIAIPLPQRDLHLDTSRPLAVSIAQQKQEAGDRGAA